MNDVFPTADALFSALVKEPEAAARMGLLRSNRALLSGPLLNGVGGQAEELAARGETGCARQAFSILAEAAEAIDEPSVRLVFLLKVADLCEEANDAPAARDASERTYALAAERLEKQDLRALPALVNASGLLGRLALREGDADHARQVLSEARRIARQVRSRNAEMWILANLIQACIAPGQEEHDWASATTIALEVGRQLADAPVVAREGDLPAPDALVFAPFLRTLTVHAYDAEDFESSAALARAWRLAAPQDDDAARELAWSAGRIGAFAEAEGVWRELLAGAPDDPSLYANLSGSMLSQGHYAEALEALERAIALAPDDLKFRRFMVQARRAMGDVAGAIVALSELIERAEAALERESQDVAAAAAALPRRTASEYERNMPLRDALDLALVERATLYERSGDVARALDDLGQLVREADPATAARALRRRSELLLAQGNADDAIEALKEAMQRTPSDPALVMTLGRVLAEQAKDREAVEVLSALVLREDNAGDVVAVLTPVVARAPSNTQARLVRGFAAETAGHPGIAYEDFSVVLEGDNSNPELLYRRGRIALTQGETTQDEGWNRTLSRERVLRALDDFALAAKLDPGHANAQHSLRWLVDRLCLTEAFRGLFLSARSERSRAVFEFFPTLEPALARFLPTLHLGSIGQRQQALTEWRALQGMLLEIPMPVSACRIDMHLADVLLRLDDLQGAREHLQRAENLLFLISQPMSLRLEKEAAETRKRSIRESGQPTIALEREIAQVYPFFLDTADKSMDALRVDVLGRVGDTAGMLATLERHPELELEADAELFNAQVHIAARLCDAGEFDRALALADRLAALVLGPQDRVNLLNLRGSIHLNVRHLDEAEADFRAAMEAKDGRADSFAPFISLNLARALIDKQQFSDARVVLDAAKGKLEDPTTFEAMTWHWLLAETAQGLDEVDVALAEVATALRLAEQWRAALRDPADRMTLQARLVQLDNLALMIALKAQDVPLIFAIVERTRARAYIDAMHAGASAVPESARELVESVQRLRERRCVLDQLSATIRLNGSTFVDVDLVRELSRIAPEIEVVHRIAGARPMMSSSRLEQALRDTDTSISFLEARIDVERTAASEAAVGAPLDLAAVAALLRERSSVQPDGAAIVLVEFCGINGSVIGCLALRSGETTPTVHTLGLSPGEITALASSAPWGADGTTADEWPRQLASIVAPAIERSNPGDLLWIVPYGPLHQVPLHAALIGDGPLLERNPVCYSPSASALPPCFQRSRGRCASAIVFGDARNDLPSARAEALNVAARFGTQAFLGAAATEQAFLAALAAGRERIDVVHFATHSTFDVDDALGSAIDLAGSGATARLTARDILRCEVPVELVTLSACQSGRTRVFAGDEPVGLTRAFLVAGASSVLATLWVAEDFSTRLIVERFYDAVQSASDPDARWRKAQALREAALAVRSMKMGDLLNHRDDAVAASARDLAAARGLVESDRPFAAPRHWAPFALVGAWT